MATWTKRTEAEKSRAKRYRARTKSGDKPLTPAELAWFERYEAGLDLEFPGEKKESESDPVAEVPPESDEGGRSPADTDPQASPAVDVTVADPAPDVVVSPPPPPPKVAPPPPTRAPKAPPLPPPPRSYTKAEQSGSDGSWQSKYWSTESTGREGTCKMIADQVYTILHHMQNQCKDVGVDPMIDLEKVSGCFVVAVDSVLPPEFVIKPEHIAAAATAATVTQRWVHRKAISEAQRNVAGAKDTEARKAKAEDERKRAAEQARHDASKAYKESQARAAAASPIATPTISQSPIDAAIAKSDAEQMANLTDDDRIA